MTEWPADEVARKAVSSLVPFAKNNRIHADDQIDQVARSITEWGWTNPVLITEDGTIIAGHAQVLAAQKLGLQEIPVMVAWAPIASAASLTEAPSLSVMCVS